MRPHPKWRCRDLTPLLLLLAICIQSASAYHETFSFADFGELDDAQSVSDTLPPTITSSQDTPASTTSQTVPPTDSSPTCFNDGLDYDGHCYCSSPYIVTGNNKQSCNNYECLNYGRPVGNACHCPSGFLGFHCEPVRCVKEQLTTVAAPRSLSLYVAWNFALKSSLDTVNDAFIEFAKSNEDVAINIMFNENLKSCTGQNQDCVAKTFTDNTNSSTPSSSRIPIANIQKLVDQAEFQSELIIWTNVAITNDSTDLSALLQSAIAKRIKVSAYVFRPDAKVHKSCLRTGAYLCREFYDLRRLVRATLGVFVAPYKPTSLAKPFVQNETLSTVSKQILSSQYDRTVLSVGQNASCKTLASSWHESFFDTIQVVVVSMSTNPRDVMTLGSAPVTVVANAGRWMLLQSQLPGSALVMFENDFPCYYEVWAINSNQRLNIGFSSNPDADVTSTVPFIALPYNHVVLQYDSFDELETATLAVLSDNDNAVSVKNSVSTLQPRPCQYNYQLPFTMTCAHEGEFQILVNLNISSYTEVVPLYCSVPIDNYSLNSTQFFADETEDYLGFDLYAGDNDNIFDDTPGDASTITTSNAADLTTTTTEPQLACVEPSQKRTFTLLIANYYPLVQKLFNVSDSASILKPLLTYMDGIRYEQYVVGLLSIEQTCSIKTSDDLEGFKNNLLNNLVNSEQTKTPTEWQFSECLTGALSEMNDDSDVFILTPSGVGIQKSYDNVLATVYSKRAAVTVLSLSEEDCGESPEGNMDVMTLSMLSGGFAMCSSKAGDFGGFIENYQHVSGTPAVLIRTGFYNETLFYTTEKFYVAEDTTFIFTTTSVGVSVLTIDDSEKQLNPFFLGTTVALFNVTLAKGTHNFTVTSMFSGKVMYKLSIPSQRSSDLLIGFAGTKIQQYPSFGYSVSPVIGGELGSGTDWTLNVFTSHNTIAANAKFSAETGSKCYDQKSTATFVCNVDYQIYFLKFSSESITTRTYSFACIPSEITCVNGEKKADGLCECFPGWTGPVCAVPEKSGCENGGKLVGASCQCPDHFHGTRCEKYSGKCKPSDVAETLRYDSQFDGVAIVVENGFVSQLSTDLKKLKDLKFGYARQYTVIRYKCDDENACSLCSPSSTTGNQNGVLQLLNPTQECNVGTTASDPLEAALSVQISARGLVIFMGDNKTLSSYKPTSEAIVLAAKRRAEIRLVSVSDDLPKQSSLSAISLNPVVQYDPLYFQNYINAILPSGESAVKDKALYVVTRGDKDLAITVEADSTYFVTYNQTLNSNPFPGSTAISNQIYVVKPSGKTLDIKAKAAGTSYTVEVLSSEKIAYGLNREISDERREFAVSTGIDGYSYLNFFAAGWNNASDSKLTPILTSDNNVTMASEKIDGHSCHYLWTSRVTCEQDGIKSVQISYKDLVRTVDFYCVSPTSCLNSEKDEAEGCKCSSQWGDIDCSRPTCNNGILDGTVCNCQPPLFGTTCSGANSTFSPTAMTSTVPPTASTVAKTTTVRPKSCVSEVNATLFIYYDGSKSTIPYLSVVKDVLSKFVSDFVFNRNASFVALYDLVSGKVIKRQDPCSFGANLNGAIGGLTASDTVDASKIQTDMKVISQHAPYTIRSGCSNIQFPTSTYAFYLSSNDGTSSDEGQTVSNIQKIIAKNITPIVIFSGASKSEFWTKVESAYPGTVYSVLGQSQSSATDVNFVDKVWTQICRNAGVIDNDTTAEPPAESVVAEKPFYDRHSGLLNMMLPALEISQQPFPRFCEYCFKIFDKPWRLRTHIAHVHLRIRPYPCMFCASGFRSPYDLRRHITIHTGERFNCDECGKSFGSKQRVASHLIKSEECWNREGKAPAAARLVNDSVFRRILMIVAPGTEHVLLFLSAFLFPPILLIVFVVVALASFGKSLGIRERYVDILIKLFEWGASQIDTTAMQKNHDNEDEEESQVEEEDFEITKEDAVVLNNNARCGQGNKNRNEADSDGGFASDSGVTFGSPNSHGSTNSLRRRHGSGTSIIRREASMHFNEVDAEVTETVVNSRGWAVINDSMDFVKAGIEAIIEDEVTSRFEAEQLASWNMLTRNSISFYQFVNWKLTALWVFGFLFRYVCLLPLRLCLFIIGLVFLIFSTAMIGLVPEGELKRSLNKRCMLICHRILSRSLSAVVYFHDECNKAMEGGICVANHTSPLDVTILSTDNVYALIGQRHSGLLGLMQRAISRASAHIFFERSEVRDRALVAATMREHVNDPHKLPILIFPEGTCINNTSVMMFKKGSFEVGTVIYPIAMKYDSRFGDAFWNSSEQGWFEYLMRMMTSWAIICNVWYLPPMERMEGEDAVDFANRVKKTIAKRGGLVDLDWDGGLKRAKVPQKLVAQQQERYFQRMTRYTSYSEKPKGTDIDDSNDEDAISFVAKEYTLADLPEDSVVDCNDEGHQDADMPRERTSCDAKC